MTQNSGSIAKEIVENYPDKWRWDDEHQTFLEYGKEDPGVWSPVGDKHIAVQISKILQDQNLPISGKIYITQIVGMLTLLLFDETWKPIKNLIGFRDGVLNLQTNQFKQHSSDYRLTWALPRNYHTEDDSNWSAIDQWLTEATEGNEKHKKQLIAFCAAVLRQRADLQIFLCLIGVGGSGKTTFTELLTLLIGENNTASLGFNDLSKQDAIAEIFQKRLLIFPDVGSLGRSAQSTFKRVTGQDRLRGRHLFKDGFYFKNEALSVVTSNQLAFTEASARWFTRRALIIPFNYVPTQPRNLINEFQRELPAFTRYLLSLPEKDIETTLRGGSGSTSQQITPTMWEGLVCSDGLASWINDVLIRAPESQVRIGNNSKEWSDLTDYDPTSSTLYGSYAVYCRADSRPILSKNKFSHSLLELLTQIGWQCAKKKTKDGMVITGVKLRLKADTELPMIEEILRNEYSGDGLGEDLKSLPGVDSADSADLSSNLDKANEPPTDPV